MNGAKKDTLWIAVTVAALLGTAAFVKHSFADAAPSVGPVQRKIENGQQYAVSGQFIGQRDARVVPVEFSDFQCPFCRRLHQSLEQLRTSNPADVAVVFRHYPLASHYFALPSAIAAECAGRQGRFEQYAALLFQMQDSIGRVPFPVFASRSGVRDTVKFKSCLTDSTAVDAVKRDIAAGGTLPLHGTPGLIIGDTLIEAAPSLDSLRRMLRLHGRAR